MMRILVTALALSVVGGAARAQNSCLTCHRQQEGDRGGPAHDWPTSVHFVNGIGCQDCHGGDARSDDPQIAMNPKNGFVGRPAPKDVPSFCGKCHEAVRDNYLQSAHAAMLQADPSAAPNCVTCHTAHKQHKVTLDLINERTCGRCHDYARAARLKEAMRGIENDVQAVTARERHVFLHGIATDDEQKAIFAVRNQAHRLTHVLEIQRILGALDKVRPDLDRVEARISVKEKVLEDRRREGNALLVLFFIGMIVAYATHKRLMHTTSG